MKTSRPALYSFCIVVVIVWLVAQAPARLVGSVLAPAVYARGSSGTIWQGSYARVVIPMDQHDLALGRVGWSLDPWSVLRLSPEIDVVTQWGAQRTEMTVEVALSGQVTVSELRARIDTAWVKDLIPLYVSGQLAIDADHLVWRDATVDSVEARVVWENAAWAAYAGHVPLGTYALDLSGVSGELNGIASTLSGPLTVEGSVSLANRAYQVNMSLSGSALNNSGLRDALTLLAVPGGDEWQIALSGTL
jgi:DNA-binding transcriptional regulator YdaS (Cro superfamily)